MGIDPANDDFIAGNPCLFCQASLFDGVTPKFIEARVKDITECPGNPAALDGTFLLTQQAAACDWKYTDGTWQISLLLFAASTSINILRGILIYFNDTGSGACADSFVNQRVTCGGFLDGGTGGTIELFWGPGIGP